MWWGAVRTPTREMIITNETRKNGIDNVARENVILFGKVDSSIHTGYTIHWKMRGLFASGSDGDWSLFTRRLSILRTDSRANFHPEICSRAAMAVTNIECHESGGLITIMKYYCHVSRVSLIASALATAQINIRMSVTQLLGHFLNPSGLQVLGFICYECQ